MFYMRYLKLFHPNLSKPLNISVIPPSAKSVILFSMLVVLSHTGPDRFDWQLEGAGVIDKDPPAIPVTAPVREPARLTSDVSNGTARSHPKYTQKHTQSFLKGE